MTMPANQTPDFIALDMDPAPANANASTDEGDDFIALDMDPTPVVESPAIESEHALAAESPVVDAGTVDTALAAIVAEGGANANTATSGMFGSIRAVETPVIGSDAPVGQGTTVFPEGVTAETYVAPVFRQTAAQRRAQWARPIATVESTEQTKTPLMAAGTLIANLVANGRGIAVSPGRADRRHTLVAASEITSKLGERFAHLAPRIKSNKAQFGEVMRSLKAGGLVTTAITRKDVTRAGEEWPEDLASRWVVGYLDGSDNLGKLGDKVLIADLLKDDTIRFTGGSDTLRQRVTDAFTTRCGERTFNATDMLNWFRAILMSEYNSVAWGGFYYVPGNPEATQACRDFVTCAKTLLGRSVAVGEVTSDAGLVEGLGEGLLDEVQEIKELFDVAQVKAAEREIAKHLKAHEGDTAGADLAGRRAVVLPEAAGTFLRRLNDTQDRINGYATMLGDDAVKAARTLLASLRATIEPLCDATSALGANIELT